MLVYFTSVTFLYVELLNFELLLNVLKYFCYIIFCFEEMYDKWSDCFWFRVSVSYFLKGFNDFEYPFPIMKTGFSLWSFFSQGKTCFHYRKPLFSLQGPCFHYRDFPVRKTWHGKPCFHYREWVCSVTQLPT